MNQDFQLLARSVVVPMELFALMAACFFGDGPRSKGRGTPEDIQDSLDGESELNTIRQPTQRIVNQEPRSLEEAQIRNGERKISVSEFLTAGGYRPRQGFTPKGYAATLLAPKKDELEPVNES